jgi:hypothetical protein
MALSYNIVHPSAMKQGSSWKLTVASQGMPPTLWNSRAITVEQLGVVVILSTCIRKVPIFQFRAICRPGFSLFSSVPADIRWFLDEVTHLFQAVSPRSMLASTHKSVLLTVGQTDPVRTLPTCFYGIKMVDAKYHSSASVYGLRLTFWSSVVATFTSCFSV